ncbi:uncharacterized protein LOC111261377 isoform X2 [Varroa jacobsoni]|uniref:Uncharacterized protein n=1 Tax=Varroa destructor TaxID=109461 RepID=A0A7M7JCD4_VARDE|nr:uncharacterized protein LOC111245638 isoform X2 [Varroa destructor]XP_022690562.1 uncharacterized protein LOC111261377 isoform X2 [Varroa jacobsoni]
MKTFFRYDIQQLLLDDRIISVKFKRSKNGDLLYLKRMRIQGELHGNKSYTTKVEVRHLEELELTEAASQLPSILGPLSSLNRLEIVGQRISKEIAHEIDRITIKTLMFTSCQFEATSLNTIFKKLHGHKSGTHQLQHQNLLTTMKWVEKRAVVGLDVQSFPGLKTSLAFSVHENGETVLQFKSCIVAAVLGCVKSVDPDPLIGFSQVVDEINQLVNDNHRAEVMTSILASEPMADGTDDDGDGLDNTMEDSGIDRSHVVDYNNKETVQPPVLTELKERVGRANSIDSGVDFTHSTLPVITSL